MDVESSIESPGGWRAPRMRRSVGRTIRWTVVGVCMAGTVAVQNLSWPDPAWANIFSLILVFIVCMIGLVQFELRRDIPRGVRLGVLGLLAGLVALAMATVRVEGVSGSLRPRFNWRWSPRADERLADLSKSARSRDDAAATKDAPKTNLAAPTEYDYPGFLGARRDGAMQNVALARDWTSQPPRLLWKQAIGAGWSAFAVAGSAAVTMEQRGPRELVTCYHLETGKLIWSHATLGRHESVLGGIGPRGTPTIHGGRVFALGATGVLSCLDVETGHQVWLHDLIREAGLTAEEDGQYVAWGRAASPLIVDDVVVVPLGGQPGSCGSLVAYETATGTRKWQGGRNQVSYSSPSLATLDGKRQIVIVNEATVAGHEPADGRELWSISWPGASNAAANVSQAVQVGPREMFVSKGYGGGSLLFEVRRDESGSWTAMPLVENNRVLKTKLTNVVQYQGHLFGLSEGVLECVEAESLESRWKRGRYGHGQILRVGELLIVQAESGEVVLLEANLARHVELGRFQAVDGNTWNNPALAGRRLLVRNSEVAACYELPLATSP